jgi:hypothetical protein
MRRIEPLPDPARPERRTGIRGPLAQCGSPLWRCPDSPEWTVRRWLKSGCVWPASAAGSVWVSALDLGVMQADRGTSPMTLLEPTLANAPVTGVAQPHQSTVDAILRAARQGLFTQVEAELMIDRVRTHVTTFPLPIADRAAS